VSAPPDQVLLRDFEAKFRVGSYAQAWEFVELHSPVRPSEAMWRKSLSPSIDALFSYRAWRRTGGQHSGVDATLAACFCPLHWKQVEELKAKGHHHPMSHAPSFHLWVPLLCLAQPQRVRQTSSASYEPISTTTAAEVVHDFERVIAEFTSAVDSEYKLLRLARGSQDNGNGWHVNDEQALIHALTGQVVRTLRGEA
jgi:hypothetical protein